jgi:hypothetical protein
MPYPFFHGTQATDIGIAGAARFAFLAPLSGDDEDSVTGTDTASAVALIARLLIAGSPDAVAPRDVMQLTAGQRDRILAALQERVFGPRIVATLRCRACAEPFDIGFALSELRAHIAGVAAADARAEADGNITWRGLRFRLPTAEDEIAVAAMPAEAARAALLERCGAAGAVLAPEALEAAMAAVDPLLDRDLPARCAECGAEQTVRFAIQSYFLGGLIAERRRLAEEVHALASAYGWSRREILAMRRATRREHVDLLATATRRRSA